MLLTALRGPDNETVDPGVRGGRLCLKFEGIGTFFFLLLLLFFLRLLSALHFSLDKLRRPDETAQECESQLWVLK